ncbi:hypothetical protein SDRG_07047 [Saprolegnia diclina VS20]|uniref:Uncharacterized protein n=1 Tax=Saprolegnia diclina (strain VS20) TaxID=1156394 RepID=T0QND0_SAPDV|nr:hypothetical protein SDRG_07047 [Saprolegnia diclina VS20]EQC35335.1 hypothetical protein SDRG_07047 [Saprolegnia diclina VS20]|eukprot:XP_008611085.1 hypothetical protein SDRG_07047 [Saprolegnia diclina VS20]
MQKGAMAVVHTGAFVRIILQYLASPNDVLALLQALPRHALDAPLAALRTLVVAAWDTLRLEWPHVRIEAMPTSCLGITLAALPLFQSIRIRSLSSLNAVLCDACGELELTAHAPLEATIAFASVWGHKIASMHVEPWLHADDKDALAHILGLCTGLDEISIQADDADQSLLAAVLGAQHATRVSLFSLKMGDCECGDWRPLFAEWLASGRAAHLSLNGFRCGDNDGLARAIAATATLTSLALVDVDSVLESFVHAVIPLPHVTQLCLSTSAADDVIVKAFLTRVVHRSKLVELEIQAENASDLTFLTALLPQLDTLQKLVLKDCDMHIAPVLRSSTSCLQMLHMHTCRMADEAVLWLLAWASTSPALTTVQFDAIPTPQSQYLDRFCQYLGQWIAAGVECVTLRDCRLDEMSVMAIESALRHARRSSSALLVCIEDVDRRYIPTLLAALPIFRSITIKRELTKELRRSAIHEPMMTLYATALAFASKWGHKVESIVVKLRDMMEATDALPRFLDLCTGLDSIVVNVDTSDVAFVAATIRAAQRVTRMHLLSYKEGGFNGGDWRLHLGAWLASGHATHLLKLDCAYGLLQGLVDAGIPPKALTELRLTLSEDETCAEPFLTNLINLSALETLEVVSVIELDATFVMALLPRLVKLQELTINFCGLHAVHAAPAPNYLRTLNVSHCNMSDETCLSLLDWASQSPCLQTVALNMCRTVRSKPELFGRYLTRWITGGVASVVLDRCVLDETSILAIANALRHSRRSTLFTLSLDVERFNLELYRMLFEALATCTGVGIRGHGAILHSRNDCDQIETWVSELGLYYDKCGFVLHFDSPS